VELSNIIFLADVEISKRFFGFENLKIRNINWKKVQNKNIHIYKKKLINLIKANKNGFYSACRVFYQKKFNNKLKIFIAISFSENFWEIIKIN